MRSVAVLVLSWNGVAFLRACLLALRAQEYAGRYAILVVDNGSTDGSADLVTTEFPEVVCLRNGRNVGFAGGNNVGLRALWAGNAPAPADFTPDLVVLLNQDTVVAPGWLSAIADAFERHPEAGLVGCKIYHPDGVTLQHTGGLIRWPTAQGRHRGAGEADTGQYDDEESVEWVTGAALAISGRLPVDLRVLDASFSPAYFEDVDICYRVRAAGYQVIYAPAARLIHHENSSLGAQSAAHQRVYHRNRVRFLLRHGPLDPDALTAFATAEMEEIARWSLADSLARKATYHAALADLSAILAARGDLPAETLIHARTLLLDLYRAVVAEERTRRAESLVPAPILVAEVPMTQPDLPQTEPDPPPTQPDPPPPPSPEPVDDPVDVAAIMRQIRRQISERRDHQDNHDLDSALHVVNASYAIYEPLRLPPSSSLPGRAWDVLRVRLHHEVRGYLDTMIYRQQEFNAAVVRSLNSLARRAAASDVSSEVEALRDELIHLREQVRLLREHVESNSGVAK
jgi:GT2 family glycosyltransferase